MKKMISAALAACAVCFLASCQQAKPEQEPAFDATEEVGPYTVTLIEPDVWHVEDCNSQNPHGMTVKADSTTSFNNCSDMYIVRGTDKAVLIDLSNKIEWADSAEVALRKIFYDRAGKRAKSILVTHNHPDHVGMLYAFANEQDVDFLLPENDFKTDTVFPARKSLIGDKGTIDLGGKVLECVQVQGHTPGSLVTFLKGHDLAFSGDAIGSGNGVWIFSKEGFQQYIEGVAHLLSYVNNPANGVNKDKLVFWPGHFWQKEGHVEVLNFQYLQDMSTLIDQMKKGEIVPEDYSAGFPYLNANFKYGTATITWNKEDAKALAQEY